VKQLLDRNLPIFGVCLGLQGVVEFFGGELGVLPTPVHGKPSAVSVRAVPLFAGLPRSFQAGRYHSLFARRESLPACLRVTAETAEGVVMAVEHESLPVAAVQFHPESIMSLEGQHGLRLLANAVKQLCA
jgi:anthranilate synthase